MKKMFVLFALILSLVSFSTSADAAQILKKTSDLISGPTIENNRVKFTLGGQVKYIQHAKYLSSDFKSPDDIGITKANTRVTGFAYSCPGYYTSRIYSDSKGQNLIGYIQVYVSKNDIKNTSCADISVPPNTPPPTLEVPDPPVSVTPPAPKPIHPVPEISVEKVVTDTVPKIPPPSKPPTVNEYCSAQWGYSTAEWELMPNTSMNSKYNCCPTGGTADYKIFAADNDLILKLNEEQGWNFWESYSESYPYTGPLIVNGFTCGTLPVDMTIEDTYCLSDQTFNSETGTCDVLEVDGDPGKWPLDMSSYAVETSDESFFGVNSGGGEETNPDNPETEKPACWCEKLGEQGYICCIFECPGWSDFMGYLNHLVEMGVGTVEAPDVPVLPAPNIPNIFDVLNSVDERNPDKPTGTEAPGLDDASFDATDLKSGPEVEFREDPTGGFDIVNPLDTLDENLSDPPLPEQENGTVNYPGGDENHSGENPPKPTPDPVDGNAQYPSGDNGTATPPEPGGTATPTTPGGEAEIPKLE